MPTLHNPAENSLFCARLGRVLAINERVEITDDEAADLAGGPIFVVEGYDAPDAPEAEPDADDADEAETDASGTPVRDAVKRGGKRVEVTRAPDVETRG